MKPIIKTHYAYPKSVGEKNTKPSMTVPDQSMTITEIINRTKKGLPVTGVKVPLYNETEDGILPDLRNLDLSELHELKKRFQQAEKQIRKDLQYQEEQARIKETEEYYKKKFAKPDTATPEEIEAEEVK